MPAAIVPAEQVGTFTMNKRGQKAVPPTPTGGVIMTTSIHPDPCKKPFGDLANQLSIINKVRLLLEAPSASSTLLTPRRRADRDPSCFG